MSRLHHALAPLVLIALILTVWEIAVRVLGTPAYLLPAPSAIAVALVDNAPILLASAGTTLGMALTALVIASIAALALALIVALSPLLESAVRPLAVVLQVTPIVAIASFASSALSAIVICAGNSSGSEGAVSQSVRDASV